MRFLLVLLAVLSGLVMPEMAAATRAQISGIGTSLPEEAVAAPQQEACLAAASIGVPSKPLPYRQSVLPPTYSAPCAHTVTLSDRPLE